MKSQTLPLRESLPLALAAFTTILALLGTPPVARAQITDVASGDWDLGTTWSDGMTPSAANAYNIVNGFTVTAHEDVPFAQATTLTVTGGTLSLGFSRGEPIDPADNVVLSSDNIDDSANAGRSDLADPAILLSNTAQGFSVTASIDDYIGFTTQNTTSSASSELNLAAGITVGGLTDLNATPDEQSGGSPRELINVASDGAASVVTVTNDAHLDSVLLTFDAVANGSSDIPDGGGSGTLTLGLTGNETPTDMLSLSTRIAIDLFYAPVVGDFWTVFDNWGTIDNQFVEVVTAAGSAFPLGAGESFAFSLQNGDTEAIVTVVPEPSRAILLVLGLIGAAALRRRRS